MKIGVDTCCWSNERGYGRLIRNLLPAMVKLAPDDEFVCFVDPTSYSRFDLEEPNVRVVAVKQSATPSQAASAGSFRSPFDILRLTQATRVESPDVFFSPSVYTYYPLPPRLPAVVTIHDTIPERFPQLTLPSWRARLFWNGKVQLAIWQSRLILTVSDYAARDLTSVLGIPPHRIRVTSEAPSPSFRPSRSPVDIRTAARRWGLPERARWILYVGGFNPHKNVDSIVRAHARVVKDPACGRLYLLLVGAVDRDVFHSDQARIRAEIQRSGTGELVKWTGFVPDEDLRQLYSGAVALVLPSACEGFGLPAVEAAALRDQVEQAQSQFLLFYIPSRAAVYPEDWNRIKWSYAMSDADWSPSADAYRLSGICERLALNCLIELTAFKKRAEELRDFSERLYYETDGHWTPAGHRLAAELIAAQLTR